VGLGRIGSTWNLTVISIGQVPGSRRSRGNVAHVPETVPAPATRVFRVLGSRLIRGEIPTTACGFASSAGQARGLKIDGRARAGAGKSGHPRGVPPTRFPRRKKTLHLPGILVGRSRSTYGGDEYQGPACEGILLAVQLYAMMGFVPLVLFLSNQ